MYKMYSTSADENLVTPFFQRTPKLLNTAKGDVTKSLYQFLVYKAFTHIIHIYCSNM